MDQFVVLHHKLPNDHSREDHWDLMLQHRDVLRTWALDTIPDYRTICNGVRLPDHDLKYLDYEGPISGDRGTVERVMSGNYEWLNHLIGNEGTAQLVVQDMSMIMSIRELSSGNCRFEFK